MMTPLALRRDFSTTSGAGVISSASDSERAIVGICDGELPGERIAAKASADAKSVAHVFPREERHRVEVAVFVLEVRVRVAQDLVLELLDECAKVVEHLDARFLRRLGTNDGERPTFACSGTNEVATIAAAIVDLVTCAACFCDGAEKHDTLAHGRLAFFSVAVGSQNRPIVAVFVNARTR
jgi:hypothetical protein